MEGALFVLCPVSQCSSWPWWRTVLLYRYGGEELQKTWLEGLNGRHGLVAALMI